MTGRVYSNLRTAVYKREFPNIATGRIMNLWGHMSWCDQKQRWEKAKMRVYCTLQNLKEMRYRLILSWCGEEYDACRVHQKSFANLNPCPCMNRKNLERCKGRWRGKLKKFRCWDSICKWTIGCKTRLLTSVNRLTAQIGYSHGLQLTWVHFCTLRVLLCQSVKMGMGDQKIVLDGWTRLCGSWMTLLQMNWMMSGKSEY